MQFYSGVALCFLTSVISALPAGQPDASPGYLEFPIERGLLPRSNALKSRDAPVFANDLSNDVFGYWMYASVGTPLQFFKFLVDTGSSDIFVFDPSVAKYCSDCTDKYFYSTKSSSFVTLPDYGPFGIKYGDGSGVQGYYAVENVGVAGKHVSQVIGIAENATGSGWENGIFGLGLDKGESFHDRTKKYYPGFITNLVDQGVIQSHTYSVWLNSKTASDTALGSIIFGGYDNTKWTGNLTPFPMVEPAPDGQYRLDVKEPTMKVIVYSDVGVAVTSVAAVSKDYTVLMDTGTSGTNIPTAQFNIIANAIGAQIIGNGPFYHVDCGYIGQLGGIEFDFDGPHGKVSILVPWAELLSTRTTLPAGRCQLGITPAANKDVDGVYILGDTFIRSTYLLFNFDEMNIYIAQVTYNHQKRSEIKAIRSV